MKHIKKLRFLLPLLAICLLIAGATPASADDYEFLSSTDDLTVKTDAVHTVIDGVKEADITLTKTGGATVKAHVLLVKPWAKASFKPVVPGYYTENSTKADRAAAAAEWTNSDWTQLGLTNMIKEYDSAADTSDEPVIAAINGDFSLTSGAPRGPVVMEGNYMMHSNAAEDEFLFGRKDTGALNIVQRISGQKDLYDSAICGGAYILRNGSLFGVDNENTSRQRTGIAIRTNGDVLLITTEQEANQSSGITVKQLGQLMQASGCWNGINMDGGGSITFMTKREDDSSVTRRTPDVADSYADKDENGERKICSALMLVADEDAVANNVPDVAGIGNTVKTDKDTYVQGEPVMVTATTTVDGSWAGLVPASEINKAKPESIHWYYIYGANDAGTWGWENGATYDICKEGMPGDSSTSALTPGEYYVAIMNYAESGDGYDVYASKKITLEADPDAVTIDYSLKTDKDVYEVGEPIMTTVTAPVTDAKAWVGITEHGHVAAENNATYYWYYSSGSNPGAEGTVTHINGTAYNLLAQEQIGDYDMQDKYVNTALVDRANRQLLPGTYDIIVYPADGYEPAVDKSGNTVIKTITVIDTKAEYSITYKDGENDITGLSPATYKYADSQTGAIALPETAEKSGHEFAGWYETADFSGNAVTEIPKGSSGNKTFYAKFNKVGFDVTFDTDGGTAVEKQIVAYGDKAVKPADPVKDGYIFLGWVIEKGGIATFDFDKAITGTTTVYANWHKVTEGDCAVTFDTTGGSDINKQIVAGGNTAVKPENPVRTGYTFDKWVTTAGGTDEFDFNTVIAADTVIYAKWTPVEYKITFNTDGGSEVADKTYTVETETFTLPVTAKAGYEFQGWKTASGETVASVEKGTTGDMALTAVWKRVVSLTTDKTTYFKGQPIKVTAYCESSGAWVGLYKEGDVPGTEDLSYFWYNVADHNGTAYNLLQSKNSDNTKAFEAGNYKIILFGDGGYSNVLMSKDIVITESNNPLKGTLTMKGYSRNDKEYSGAASSERGSTLYEYLYGDAIYADVTVSGDGAEEAWVGIITDTEYNSGTAGSTVGSRWYYLSDFEGKSVNLNDTVGGQLVPDAEDIPFGLNYWVVLVSGSGEIIDGAPFNYRTFNVDWLDSDWGPATAEKLQISTDWTSSTVNGENQKPGVTIKHIGHFGYKNVNGELVEVTEKILKEGHDYTLSYPAESKEAGTYTIKVSFPSVQPSLDYYNYLSVTPDKYGLKDGITYTLKESATDHTITYVLNGGKNHPENKSLYKEGETVTLMSPSKAGCVFAGWYTTADFQDETQISEIAAGSKEDFTVYAKWISENDTKYKITYVLNGGTNNMANPIGHTGETDITLLPAEKSGYIFEGWFYDPNFKYPADTISSGINSNLTLYAKFTKEVKETYEITTAVKGGSISDDATLEKGENYTVKYKPNGGYELVSVTVDGVKVDIAKYPSSYTFENVTANHDISVVCKKIPGKAVISSIVAQNGKITAKWNKVTGATSYKVYRSANGGKTYKLILTTKKTSTTSKVLAAQKYKYKVQAVNDGVKGKMSSVKSVTVLAKVKNLKVTSNKNKTVALKWNKVKNAKKYVVYKSTNGGKTYKKVLTTSKNTAKFKKLKKGSKIRYKVRAIDGKSYGKFSDVKKVTVK